MTTDTLSALAYYSRHGAALFPIPAGQKNPVGIVSSFVHDNSRAPAQWQAWLSAHPQCNWGVVAGASDWIIVDIDVKAGRDAAWTAWCELCASWGIPVAMPHVATPSGGWHVYFSTTATDLRQPDAIKGVINVRAGNGFTVAAGSTYNGTAYTFLSDSPPYPAPDALVRHCTRAAPPTGSAAVGTYDRGDVAALVKWLTERDQFATYEDWVGIGMALKLEFGDAGFEIWQLATWDDAQDAAAAKWSSFATEPTGNSVTLRTYFDRAHAAGWHGSVRKSASSMFDGVAAIAAAAGATLSGGSSPMPMVAGQQALTDIGTPILTDFLSATTDAPVRPANPDFPTLPDACSGHGLYSPLQDCIARIIAMAETPKTWKPSRATDALALLSLVHRDTFDAVCRRVRTLGATLHDSKIKLAANRLAEQVERVFVTQDDWIYDAKGNIESDNSDNVVVFLGVIGCELRWNAWLERAEIRGGDYPDWTYIDDAIVATLRTRGNRTKTRFRPTKDFFWDTLIALARANAVDPAMQRLDALAAAWDGKPRLSIWLSRACGTPCDVYHQAVGRNIIGGMVRRIREPGCKHDLMPIFYGYQGSSKSTMAAVIGDMGQSTVAQIKSGKGHWFTDTIQLGDEAKELVLALGGVAVAEIGEMGMRNGASASHIKAMVSRQIDRGRTAYARAVAERPRRNVFFGTTNDGEPLTDPTGNRRFLPVRVDQEIDLEWLSGNIAQIVGEAARLHSQGVSFDLPRSVWSIAAEHQEAARNASDLEVYFNDWFAETTFTHHAFITAADLARACNRANLRHNGRADVMKRLGFRQARLYVDGKRGAVWLRGPFPIAPDTVRYTIGTDPQSGEVIVRIVKA